MVLSRKFVADINVDKLQLAMVSVIFFWFLELSKNCEGEIYI